MPAKQTFSMLSLRCQSCREKLIERVPWLTEIQTKRDYSDLVILLNNIKSNIIAVSDDSPLGRWKYLHRLIRLKTRSSPWKSDEIAEKVRSQVSHLTYRKFSFESLNANPYAFLTHRQVHQNILGKDSNISQSEDNSLFHNLTASLLLSSMNETKFIPTITIIPRPNKYSS